MLTDDYDREQAELMEKRVFFAGVTAINGSAVMRGKRLWEKT